MLTINNIDEQAVFEVISNEFFDYYKDDLIDKVANKITNKILN